MDEAKSVVPSGAYGIPKWIMKKGMRYEVDDFIVSPPSHEDGEFLRLRYGRNRTPDMAQQEAGQDGGMTVEVRDDTLQFSATPPTPTTTITIGPGGLSVDPSPASTPLTTPETASETSNVHPLLVLPMNFGGEPKFVVKTDPVDFSKTKTESFGPTASKESAKEAITTTTNSLECSIHPTHDTNTLLEKVQALSIISSPLQSVEPSPVTSPHLSPRSSPLAQRRLLGMAMEPQRKISAHSYFCTKQFQDPQRDKAGNISLEQERGLSLESTLCTKQLDEGAIAQHALDPKMMGRKRRQPKPSALREMNFWAPTSM